MPVTIVKPKAKVIDKVVASSIVSPETVDEYASKKAKLDTKMEKITPLSKEVAALEKGIIGAVDEVIDPSVGIDLQGYENELKLGAKGKRTALSDAEKVFDMVGSELFFKLATIKVTDLKAYLTPDQLEEVTESTYAIKRRVKVEAI